jgi:hypothetical protein
MSHTTIYFLTEAESYADAEENVTVFLGSEHFYDYSSVLPESSGSLTQKRNDIEEFVKDWNWEKDAINFYKKAKKQKASGNLKTYGYYLINAGQLYAQHLTTETYVFNIKTIDYSIPKEDKNWWVIAMDFHY